MEDETNNVLSYRLLTHSAVPPRQASENAAGFDIASTKATTIPPNTTAVIPTGLALQFPAHTYGQLMSRSGLASKHSLMVCGGVIDPDYTGEIKVILHNSGTQEYHINIGDRIAQLILLHHSTPSINHDDTQHANPTTSRGANGFGSTGISVETNTTENTTGNPTQGPSLEQDPNKQAEITPPYQLIFSTDPYDNILKHTIDTWGTHATVGLSLHTCPIRHRPQLKHIYPGTPAARLPKWRSTLRNAYVTKVNDISVTTTEQIITAISNARANHQPVHITFATMNHLDIHPQLGVPQIHFDQLNTIAKHLQQIRNAPTIRLCQQDKDNMPQHLTWSKIKQRDDYNEWIQSRYKQLDQYEAQEMFEDPAPLPKGANLLPLIWTYVLKPDGTKKARCVCDGNIHRKGTVVLGHTYANSLEQPAARLFWAIAAKQNLTVIGADVSNAFAEAPPPAAPTYVTIDDAFKDWWVNHKGRDPEALKPHYVLKVKHAIQGHPESPRLWEKHIDGILQNMGFHPTTHEPCLYRGVFHDQTVYLLRQVDDFALASPTASLANTLISEIDSKMTMQMKSLGCITRFNGIDIEQTSTYIKLHATTYLSKILAQYPAVMTQGQTTTPATPMNHDTKYQRDLELAQPSDTHQLQELETQYGYTYRSAIGELIYVAITCRPDIMYATIKLSQYATKPSAIHFQAIHHLMLYLYHTLDHGIYYWRDQPNPDLPAKHVEPIYPDNYTLQVVPPQDALHAYVDSDWAGDTSHRKSVTGLAIMFAGAVIGYKTRYQDTIAHSTTEAEFVAAADAGRTILYFRTMLHDLGIPQQHATVLYEDNQGALKMAQAQQPTRRTRHLDIKHFALLDWVQRDLITLHSIATNDNCADTFTKALPAQLHRRHYDTIMGKRALHSYVDRDINDRPEREFPHGYRAQKM